MKIKNLIWYWIGNRLEWIWPFRFFRFLKPGIDIVGRKSVACIEGYPRSGNTYVYATVTLMTSEATEIAHHLHCSAQLKEAIRLRVPTLFVARAPSECIASYIVREQIPIRRAIVQYLRLYRFVFAHREHLTVIDFNKAMSDGDFLRSSIIGVIPSLSDKLLPTQLDINEKVRRMDMEDTGKVAVDPMRVGMPNSERDSLKKAVIEQMRLDFPSELAECQALYVKLVSCDE